MQVKLKLFLPEIVSALENNELLSNFRAYRKSTLSAQTDRQITKDGPLYTGPVYNGRSIVIDQPYCALVNFFYII